MEKNRNDKRFTAKEARELMNESNVTMTRIYKEIKEYAKENQDKLTWEAYELNSDVRDKITNQLNEDGYRVSYDDEYNVLNISWKD